MIYYVVKNVSAVTQAQINASTSRRLGETRHSNDGSKCVIKFDDSMKEYFMNEEWLTLDEVKAIMEGPEWQPVESSSSFIDKTLMFFGLK